MRKRRRSGLLPTAVVFSACALAVGVGWEFALDSEYELVSISSDGQQGDGKCQGVSLSADGRYAVFASLASNLVEDDTNEAWDVFVRDRQTGVTECVSVSSQGVQGNGGSTTPAISDDGRFVVFVSEATNLVLHDRNRSQDVFVRDREDGATERVSVSTDGVEGDRDSGWFPAISADGRYVAFVSLATNLTSDDENPRQDVFIRDREKGQTERVSVPVGDEVGASGWLLDMSADGRYVVFASTSPNLLSAKEDTNGSCDVFVRDRRSGTTERVSVPDAGGEADGDSGLPAISDDGRLIAFISEATNLVDGDTNGKKDVFVRDRIGGRTVRMSVSSDGAEANGDSAYCAVSGDGRLLAFHSPASNLVPGDGDEHSDVFVRDLRRGKTRLVSATATGAPGNGPSEGPAISSDGMHIAFLSAATDLVADDANKTTDVFVSGLTESRTGRAGCGGSGVD